MRLGRGGIFSDHLIAIYCGKGGKVILKIGQFLCSYELMTKTFFSFSHSSTWRSSDGEDD